MKRIRLLLLLCLALVLTGCREETPAAVDVPAWETVPSLNYGTLAYDRLEALPWNSGRCEATGDGYWAETELGFYTMLDFRLYYADKANMGNWVVVCNQPDCTHSIEEWSYGDPVCTAEINCNSFLLREGRIYTLDSSAMYPELYTGEGQCMMLISKAPDGSDTRLEYYIQDSVSQGGGSFSSLLNYDHWLLASTLVNTDGSYTHRLFRVTPEGEEVLAEYTTQDQEYSIVGTGILRDGLSFENSMAGENLFTTTFFGDSLTVAYRIRNGKPEPMGYMDCYDQWSYLSGDILRVFHKNDGFYDINMATGEEVKVAEAEGKYMTMFLPNCITASWRDDAGFHLELFDGKRWREVTLHPDLVADMPSFRVQCVASDRILVKTTDPYTDYNDRQCHIWQIMLDRKELVMEYCGPIGWKENK